MRQKNSTEFLPFVSNDEIRVSNIKCMVLTEVGLI